MKHEYYYVSLVKNDNNKLFTFHLPRTIYQTPSTTLSLKLISCKIDADLPPPKEQGTVQIGVLCQEISSNFYISIENEILGGECGVLAVINANIFKRGKTKTEDNSMHDFGYCNIKQMGCLNKLNFNLVVLSYPTLPKFQEFQKISNFVLCLELVEKQVQH